MLITSLDNQKIKKIMKLKQKKYREEYKMFLIEGEHLVNEAIKSNMLIDLLVLENSNLSFNYPYITVSSNIMKKLSNMESLPKVIGICKFKESNNNFLNKVLILDNIQDPGNLGTIIRSCVAFNIKDIILSLDTVDLYNDKVIRSSQGMVFKVNIIKDDIKKVIKDLKTKNYLIVGTDVLNGTDIRNIKDEKIALVMGNEGQGVKKEIKNMCDKDVYIKMHKDCESLNVGVATSILLYELSR